MGLSQTAAFQAFVEQMASEENAAALQQIVQHARPPPCWDRWVGAGFWVVGAVLALGGWLWWAVGGGSSPPSTESATTSSPSYAAEGRASLDGRTSIAEQRMLAREWAQTHLNFRTSTHKGKSIVQQR
ncbi:hypothetical protein B484DRAFT_435903 [Ochromonadaceae sp. CCMP2298]|nr:hypothetical protein B484DRAFT_435903 [Ochromonadaceae sp. CCMP2298]